MMFGGIFMFGFMAIAMVLVIGLPVALIAVLVWVLARQGNSPAQVPSLVFQNRASTRACSHCGAALQTGWSHCSQCGAPV